MQKLLTVTVPSYNSEAYLAHALDTLLPGGSELDVIIVNDGSKDGTAALAQSYVDRWPEIFRLVNKENGGHGSGVNKGIELAEGLFFRVLDSDDWVDPAALKKLLDYLRQLTAESMPDMLITNYIYEYTHNNTTRQVRYSSVFHGEKEKLYGWNELGVMRFDQLFAMHSLTYRTEVLRQSGLRLPEHTFYVDNLYDYIPLPWVDKLVWLDLDLYHYFIGRDDQSVATPTMIKRIDQQLLVTRLMCQAYHLDEIKDSSRRRYMYRWLSMILTISQIHLLVSNTPENLAKIQPMWDDLKEFDPDMYKKIRGMFLNVLTSLPGELGRFIDRKGFFLVQKIFKFS